MAMPPDKVRHAISFLTGEVGALLEFSKMMAQAYPDHAGMLARLNELAQLKLVSDSPQQIGDAVHDGYQFVLEHLRKAVEVAQGTQLPHSLQ
jgi:hypothetical protein